MCNCVNNRCPNVQILITINLHGTKNIYQNSSTCKLINKQKQCHLDKSDVITQAASRARRLPFAFRARYTLKVILQAVCSQSVGLTLLGLIY